MPQGTEVRHIVNAQLTSAREGVVELNRDWKASRLPPVSMKGKPRGEFHLFALPVVDYARKSGYFVEESGDVVFVLFPQEYPSSEYDGSKVFVVGSFNGWQEAVGDAAWQLKPETIGGVEALVARCDHSVFECDDGCHFKFVTEHHDWLLVQEDAPNLQQDGGGNWNYVLQPQRSGRHRFGFSLKEAVEFSEDNVLLYRTRKGVEECPLALGDFFFGLSSDKELGAIVSKDRVTFRLFAPRARWVKVGLFRDLEKTDAIEWLLMKRADDYVWEAEVEGDWAGAYYWYRLDGPKEEGSLFDPEFRVLDPYAKASVTREGPGIVVDAAAYGKRKDSFTVPQWQDLVILEAHVRDLVVNAGVEREDADAPLGFSDLSAFVERDDFYAKRLGVNAIELQPIQENDSQSYDEYHWGYMTANFFAPHSGYARSPETGSQIEEFRELVATCHRNGFSVILDVVYNHVGEPAHLMYIDKRYYFHGDAAGKLTNWSGCGNDLRTDAPMAQRLVLDSLLHLVEFYGVDGFRFDLADLVGKPTLVAAQKVLKAVRPDLVLIAEPWSFRGHIGRDLRDTSYASWNDGYREFIKEYVRGERGVDAASYFLRGSPDHYASWPAQTVNYVESHDDRTWLDDITENFDHDGTYPTSNDIARTRMMAALLMVSVGMPMLHAGMDFLVTKNGVHNTYQDGPRNALDYQRGTVYPAVGEFFAAWVALRRSPRGAPLRPYSRADDSFFEFVGHPESNAFYCVINAKGTAPGPRLFFAANPGLSPIQLAIGGWATKEWLQIADHERCAGAEGYLEWPNLPQEGSLFLPALATGCWELRD